jgi:hypothetical protein
MKYLSDQLKLGRLHHQAGISEVGTNKLYEVRFIQVV